MYYFSAISLSRIISEISNITLQQFGFSNPLYGLDKKIHDNTAGSCESHFWFHNQSIFVDGSNKFFGNILRLL